MKRINNFLQLIVEYPVIALSIMYAYWLITSPVDSMVSWGLILFCAYFIATMIEKIKIKNEIIKIIPFSLFIIIGPLGLFVAFGGTLLLFDYGIPSFSLIVIFFLGCALIVLSTYRKFSSDSEQDSKFIFAMSLPILYLSILFFALCYPIIEETVTFNGYRYYLTNNLDGDFHSYSRFYKCKIWGFSCESFIGDYSMGKSQIIIDKQNGEVSLLEGASKLRFTDGKNPRSYYGYSEQLQDELYLLSDKCNNFTDSKGCEIYTYTLYICKLNYTSCAPLAIQYTADYGDFLILEANQNAKEISLYDDYDYNSDRTLIFTYGEHPRCYVEGCEILK